MSFFNKGDDNPETPEQTETPEMIKVGDEEYAPDQLQELVGLGKIGKEAEEKFNTSIDKVWPDYGRKSNRVKELEKELEGYKNKPEEPKPEMDITDKIAVEKAQKAARDIDLILKDDFEPLMREQFRSMYQEERAAERLLESTSKLEKEIDGSDGRPAFNSEEILTYMRDEGFRDPLKAYEDKYRPQTDEWRANQILQAKKPGLKTNDAPTGVGGKQPKPVKVTHDNLSQLMREALGQSEREM